MGHCFLISTLAEYQTRFWLKVGHEIKARGEDCAFLSFDDRSTEMLRSAGFVAYTLHDLPSCEASASENQMRAVIATYDLGAVEGWFLHERVAYGEQNHGVLLAKLYRSLRLAEIAIAACRQKYEAVSVIQEVGGFLSVIGCYAAAKKEGVTNWFIEPAFFKGRLFFTPDSFAAPIIANAPVAATLPEVRDYLENALKTQQIVIPDKDKHHYSSARAKMLSRHNAKRLIQKSFDKYVLGKKQEFGYLGRQIGVHLRMFLNSVRLRNSYTALDGLGRFLYFPLHVPGDMALTLRSPEYVDQFALLEQILRATPLTHRVAVKEHPAMIGALSAARFKDLLRRYPQCAVIAPTTNNYTVLQKTDLVISINSKSGAEAALLGKPVLVMGEAFYSSSHLVTRLDSPRQLKDAIQHALTQFSSPDRTSIMEYFHAVWDSCVPGELYISDPDKISSFTSSLIDATGVASDQLNPVMVRHA